MKKILVMSAILLGIGYFEKVQAAMDTVEMPIVSHSPAILMSVSTSAYTNVSSSTVRIANLAAVLIDNPSTNSAIMHGHIGNCTSTSVSTSTVLGPIELAPSLGGGIIGIAEDECLWLISRHTSAENVMIQGVAQKR